MLIKSKFFSSNIFLLLTVGTLTSVFRDGVLKKSQKCRNQDFFLKLCYLLMEDPPDEDPDPCKSSRIRIREVQKLRVRIRNTHAAPPQDWPEHVDDPAEPENVPQLPVEPSHAPSVTVMVVDCTCDDTVMIKSLYCVVQTVCMNTTVFPWFL